MFSGESNRNTNRSNGVFFHSISRKILCHLIASLSYFFFVHVGEFSNATSNIPVVVQTCTNIAICLYSDFETALFDISIVSRSLRVKQL